MKRLVLVLALLLGFSPALAAVPAQAASPQRATWVWTRPAVKTLVSWAVKQRINELFVHVAPGFSTTSDRAWVASVSAQAHASGVKVSALGGDAAWIDSPATAVSWAREAAGTGLFDGLHLDVEPWVRADWDSNQAGVVAAYLAVLRQVEAATPLRLEADVAFWLWQVPSASGPLDAAVLDIVDAITVMSYRNFPTGPNSITDIGAHELATAAAKGRPCRLAVETNDLGSDAVSKMQTFYGSTQRRLANALATVDSVEAGVTSYAGVAVEDQAGWVRLR
jgi:hypothetical protein